MHNMICSLNINGRGWAKYIMYNMIYNSQEQFLPHIFIIKVKSKHKCILTFKGAQAYIFEDLDLSFCKVGHVMFKTLFVKKLIGLRFYASITYYSQIEQLALSKTSDKYGPKLYSFKQ